MENYAATGKRIGSFAKGNAMFLWNEGGLDTETALCIDRLRNRKLEDEQEQGNILLIDRLHELTADLSESPSNTIVLRLIRTAIVHTLEETARPAEAERLCIRKDGRQDQNVGDLLLAVLAHNFGLSPYPRTLERLFEITWSMLQEAGKLKRKRRKPRH